METIRVLPVSGCYWSFHMDILLDLTDSQCETMKEQLFLSDFLLEFQASCLVIRVESRHHVTKSDSVFVSIIFYSLDGA